MGNKIIWLIAVVNAAAFVTLWFWVVRRELYEKQKAVKAARCQLAAARQAYLRARDGPEEQDAGEIFIRSQSVYRQAAAFYNRARSRPWNIVPALVLGFNVEDNVKKPLGF